MRQTNYIVQRMFSQHKVPEQFVLDYLYKVYLGTLKSMVDNDEEFLDEYLEQSFAEKLKLRLKEMREKGYKFKLVEEVVGREGQVIPNKVEILDGIFIRGLSMDRKVNETEENYHVYDDSEGLVGLPHFRD